MSFTTSPYCQMRIHCRVCRRSEPWRRIFERRFGPWTCPLPLAEQEALAKAPTRRVQACQFCGYRYDHELLGRYGCPNCEGRAPDATVCLDCEHGGGISADGLAIHCDACPCPSKTVSLVRGRCPKGKW